MEAPAENFLIWVGGLMGPLGGVVWWRRGGLAAFVLRFVLFFDVVVDVPVVQIVDVGVQLLDKVVLPVIAQDRGFGPDSAACGVPKLQFLAKEVTCPLLRRQVHGGAAGAVLVVVDVLVITVQDWGCSKQDRGGVVPWECAGPRLQVARLFQFSFCLHV